MREGVSHVEHRAIGPPYSDDSLHPEGVVETAHESGDDPGRAPSPLSAAARPRLKGSVDVFTASDGTIYLIRPSREDLMIKSPPPGLASFLGSLDGKRDVAGLVEGFDVEGDLEVEAAVDQLWNLGLLEDAARDGAFGIPAEDAARYDRQLGYFAELAPPGMHREEFQARLAQAKVTVLGLGGLGCWTAVALACTGIGRLTVVDGDIVELSNLNRQMLYTPADLGQSKALAGARVLARFNPSIEVVAIPRRLEDEAAVLDVTAGSDVVVELADWPVGELTRWSAGVAHRLGIPHVQASQDPPMVRLGPTFIPGETGCAECRALATRRQHALYDEVIAFRAARVAEVATFGPACAVIGGILANEVVNVLLGLAAPATAGRAASVDLRTLKWSWDEPVPADPECGVCSARPPDNACARPPALRRVPHTPA
jgi:bacteriocin biosynthesis cyclodehydratase domain-containing protein